MEAPTSTDINFKLLFESVPGLFLVLKTNAPQFTIAAVSDAYLSATMTVRETITGKGLFEIFPDNPDDPTADGTDNLRKSLERVLANKTADTMPIQKYDIPRPESEGGGFEERYWSPVNTPVAVNGQITYIIHRVEDVTKEVTSQKRAIVVEEALEEKSVYIKDNQDRINSILDILLKYTVMDFSQQINISPKGDELDAISIGLNTLSEELEGNLKQIRESEARSLELSNFLNTILENIPNMIFVKDAKELRFVRFNTAGEKLLGFSRNDLIGKNDSDFFPKEQADFFIDKDKEVLSKKELLDIPEEIIQTSNGKKWLHTQKIPILDENGTPVYLLGISEDITEQKEKTDQIKELNKDLEVNLSQLESVNKELESFSYSISHDLRAPLRAINGYATIIEEDYQNVLDDEGKRLLNNIQYNAAKMGNLIDDLLSFSRLGRKEVQKTNVQTRDMVDAILVDINKTFPNKAQIKVNTPDHILADYSLIQQVVYNLIANAIKYSSKKEAPEVEITTTKTTNEIIVCIKDNGAGFDMKYAHKLFGVFQRLHTSDEFEGTGVGLAIVQRIVAKHGGKVWAEGVPDKGASFYFSLPLNQ